MSDGTLNQAGQAPDNGGPAEGSTSQMELRPRAGRIQRTLWWLAAVEGRVMAKSDCYADWRRYAILGSAVLVTALLATCYGTVVVFNYYIHDAWVAVPCGIAWGSIILICDRLMLVSLVKAPDTRGVKLAFIAGPRIGLALLIAAAVSVPAELVLFESQIEKQLAVQHQEDVAEQQGRLAEKYADIPRLDSLERALENEIKLKDETAAEQFKQAACEADGTCGSMQSGDGFRYDVKLARYAVLKAEADRVRSVNERLIEGVRAERNLLAQQRNQELDAFSKVAGSAKDLLSRITALEALK